MTDAPQVPATREHHSLKDVGMERRGSSTALTPQSMADVVRFAEIMARGEISLPKHLRGKVGDCLTVTLQALDWGMNPIAVANKTYSVNDRLAYEAQLVNAVVLTRAPIIGRPIYEFSGEDATRKCKVTFTMREGRQELEYETPAFRDIPTKNSPLWKADPDQQLGYYAVRSWARRHAPEVMMGVYTVDEAAEMRDVTPARASGLAASLAEHGQGTEGFKADVVDTALAEPVADAEFSERLEDVKEAIDEALARAPAEEPEEPVDEPDFIGPASVDVTERVLDTKLDMSGTFPESEAIDDPLSARVYAADANGAKAWAEAFRAVALKRRTSGELMELWTAHFHDQIAVIKADFPDLFAKLETWMGDRLKKLRAEPT